jgi:hypothetical protein
LQGRNIFKNPLMNTFICCQIKKLFVMVCVHASVVSLKAQTFSILPANTQTVTFNCDSSMQANKVYISNMVSNTLDLSYTILSNTLPQDGCWYYQFCDWEKCKMGLPSGTNHPTGKIPANSQTGSMILDIITMTNKGAGALIVNVFETVNPSNSQIITWNVTGCTTGNDCTITGVAESISEKKMLLYPSPAFDNITITMNSNIKISSMNVYTILGENVISQVVNDLNTYNLNISNLENGIYLLEINTRNGNLIKKFVKY